MRLTTKGRFAVTAMIDLAMQGDNGPVTLAEISERQKISLSYLEQLFGKLRRHGLVASVRGPGGGYRIAKSLQQVSVADIILAVDEPLDTTKCGGKQNCREEQKCLPHDLWQNLNAKIFDYLSSVSLAQILDSQSVKEYQHTVTLHEKRKRPESVAAL
ncbi:MAG: Fe-S cluster assembly transcriptional regulator IscR [Pseudomonadota bacterium]